MSRIGARKKRLKSEWVLLPGPPEPTEPPLPTDDREYTEEEVKIACEWSLVFMLLFAGHEREGEWFRICVEQAWSYPSGSYRNVFWWSIRYLPRHGMEDFRKYLPWKINEYDSGRIRRDGPRW